MSKTVIALHETRGALPIPAAAPESGRLPLADTRGRALRDLRISVTDRCNFRCVYCMPREVFGRDHAFLPRAELLTFEEIARLASLFVAAGARNPRLWPPGDQTGRS